MKNQGISLISLIITIIVVIILAAIAIFSGFGAVDSASLADFAQKYDNVQMAVLNAYGNKLAETAISGDGYTSAQIYSWIADGTFTEYSGEKAINDDGFNTRLNMKRPTAGSNNVWNLTSTGKVIFTNGFEYDGFVYTTPETKTPKA